jgi:nitrogen-specific signal transduction histidine kinase
MLSGFPAPRPGVSLGAEPPRMSPLRALTQHPVPVIAVADDGAIVFANTAFADVMSCSRNAVTSMNYEGICSVLPPDETLVAVTRLGPNTIGRLLQLGEATLFVKMRRSAILSAADSGPVTLFEGLMRRLSRLAPGEHPGGHYTP